MKVNKKIREKILVIGVPSNGLVGVFTTSYLINNLEMKQIGEIDYPNLPPTIFIENGEILPPIRIYKKNTIFIIISDLPLDPYLAHDFAESILQYCKKNDIQKIIMTSGMDTINGDPNRRKIYGLVTHQSLEKILYLNQISKFLSGSIYGIDAVMISIFRKSKIPTLILYAECHPFFPDPEAALMVISTLSKILDIEVDLSDIKKKMTQLRIQNRNLMEETIKTLQVQPVKRPSRVPQIYR